MKINNTEYNANLLLLNGTAIVTVPEQMDYDTIRGLMDAESVEDDDGVSYALSGFSALKISGLATELRWSLASEADSLRAQLHAKTAELISRDAIIAEKQAKLDGIAESIRSLGSLPTLTSLRVFLSSIKEDIGYESIERLDRIDRAELTADAGIDTADA